MAAEVTKLATSKKIGIATIVHCTPSFDERQYHNIPRSLLSVDQNTLNKLLASGKRQTWSGEPITPPSGQSSGVPAVILNNSSSRLSGTDATTREYINLVSCYSDQGCLEFCSFYYRSMSMHLARDKLKSLPAGTFLLRDSSDRRFRFSLSVSTARATTSIRIVLTPTGRYRLDCDRQQEATMPSFNGVLDLVQHYVASTVAGRRNNCVLLEGNGHTDTPLVLRRPYLEGPETLRHLCRKSIHGLLPLPSGTDRTSNVNRLPLYDQSLKEFLREYPYNI